MQIKKHALIVDGHPLVCDALCSAVASFYPDYSIHGAYSAREAREMLGARSRRWALVLCDLNLPDEDGIELIREVRGQLQAPIVVVTGRDDPLTAQASKLSGASGFVSKGVKLEVLREALACVLAGQPYFATMPALAAISPMDMPPRHKQVLDLILSGKSNKSIATELLLSDGTVRNLVSSLFDHFGGTERTRGALIAKVAAMGYKPPQSKMT
jgi:two-component system, NarL family, response regulator, fimbrial Z protein, FimZ